MRVIGKILASAAALALVAGVTVANAAPFGVLSASSQLSLVADKAVEKKADDKKAVEKKADDKKVEKKAEPKKAVETKPVEKKAVVKKVATKKVHKKAHKKVAHKASKKGAKTCGVGKYRKHGKCLSAADKK